MAWFSMRLPVMVILFPTGILLAQDKAIPQVFSQATDYTELAFKYGPFAFAVLFGGFSMWMLKQTRTDKTQSQRHWAGFFITLITCIGFAAIGTHHWLKVAESTHIFIGEIKDLEDYEQVDGDGFYFKTELKKQLVGENVNLRNEYFAVIQDQPFFQGQRFELAYFKQAQTKRTLFTVQYDDGALPTYRIVYNEASGVSELKKIQPVSAVVKNSLTDLFTVYAQTLPAASVSSSRSQLEAQQAAPPRKGVDLRLVNLLQDTRTPVGRKIDALDQLGRVDAATLQIYAATVNSGEPFALTLIELSRHSDKEMASKASKLVLKSQAETVLAQQLSSSNREIRAAAERAVFRVTPDRADRILKQASPSARTQALSAQVRLGAKQQLLVPVGAANGDRYYLEASWNPVDGKSVHCLAVLFNREAPSSNTVEEEEKLMAGQKGRRIIELNTKESALSIAEKIKSCGGQASFSNPLLKAK